MKGKLVLEDGKEFYGDLLSDAFSCGEVVFNTSMSGYQEIFTDPSYAKQIIAMTYPLIGNYGINTNDYESLVPHLSGVIIQELYEGPLPPHAKMELKEYLVQNKIPTLYNVDCRELTLYIRDKGSLKGVISPLISNEAQISKEFDSFCMKNISKDISSNEITIGKNDNAIMHFGLIDYGYKKSIKKSLENKNIQISIFPQNTSFEKISAYKLDGIVLSNGPGNPEDVYESFEMVKQVQEKFPVLGICLGHQILALINGAKTRKMKFGHRGANHSILDQQTGRSFISSQNHSYCVDEDSLQNTDLEKRFINVNDKSIEGISHKRFPFISVQFHPEANSGPLDTHYIFDEFIQLVRSHKNERN